MKQSIAIYVAIMTIPLCIMLEAGEQAATHGRARRRNSFMEALRGLPEISAAPTALVGYCVGYIGSAYAPRTARHLADRPRDPRA